ncbi:MAG: ATP-dependent RNA helicase SrmB [Alteromonadaceae bacterium]|jgi:ATP-dependent RNA helicase SrmB
MFDTLDLDSALISAIADTGYKTPTSIQSLAIPQIMAGKDIMASAPTGTGKTAAFLLPALQHLIDFPRRSPGFARILVMTPTRELAYQIYEEALIYAKFTQFKIGVITGGVNYGSHKDILEKNNDILVATPGRLMDYMDYEEFHAEDVEILVIDEADRMLDMGFITEMTRITKEARNRKQSLLFSATLEGHSLETFADELLTDPERIEAQSSLKERGKINQWMHVADDDDHKFKLLTHIVQQQDCEKAIVFVRTREQVQLLSGKLQALDIRSCWLEGEMPQDKRNKAVLRLKNGQVKVLVATDVAARGLDIDNITHVINYDMPRTADTYVHRIGRTGRAGKKGVAISLVEAHDTGMVKKVESYTEQALRRRIIQELRPKFKEAKVPAKKKKSAVKLTNKEAKGRAKKQRKKEARRLEARVEANKAKAKRSGSSKDKGENNSEDKKADQ